MVANYHCHSLVAVFPFAVLQTVRKLLLFISAQELTRLSGELQASSAAFETPATHSHQQRAQIKMGRGKEEED